eukprot:evm.model.scf_2050.1 EVM.evm.TU.scf_2050.1   scf_2050:7752-15159(+)
MMGPRMRRATPPQCSSSAAAVGMANSSGGGNSSADTVRFLRVVAPTALVLLLCNMDRVCMSVAILPMVQQFGWSASVQGMIQSAFLLGYMATPALGGALADQYGGKVVLAVGIAWYSIASFITPLALSKGVQAMGLALPALLLARTCVGLGEGVAMPSMNNLVSRFVPSAAKATALGAIFLGFNSGTFIGLALSSTIITHFGWRAVFYLFGLLGFPALALFLWVVPSKDGPEEKFGNIGSKHPARAPVTEMLSKLPVWAVIVATVVNHWGYFICLSWMPSYFNKALGLDLRASSVFSFVPWVVMAFGSLASGIAADVMVAKGLGVAATRKIMQSVAFCVPAAMMLMLGAMEVTPALALGCLTASLAASSLGQAGFLANSSDIAPRNAGKLYGIANTFGSFAGLVGTWLAGVMVDRTGSFSLVFQTMAAAYVAGAVFFNMYCTGERVLD